MRVIEWKLLSDFPELTKDVVHIWKSDLSRLYGIDLNLLSAEELKKADKFRFEPDRKRYLASHLFLRRILSGYARMKPDRIQFQFDDNGRPSLKATDRAPFFDFNLSYSGSMGVVAVTGGNRTGVDIERIDNADYGADIVDRYFSRSETRAIKAVESSEWNEAFFRLWTGKEAFQKAQGGGLHISLDSFSIESLLLDDTVGICFSEESSLQRGFWKITHFIPADGYSGAVAYSDQVTSLEFYELEIAP